MYTYDIPYPKKDQNSLLFSYDRKHWMILNVSKSISYLKKKMKAHRDEMGSEKTVFYSIQNNDKRVLFEQTFGEGERGNSTEPYHLISKKPIILYKPLYLYYDSSEFVLSFSLPQEKLPSATFDVIFEDEKTLKTDLNLLMFLYAASSKLNVLITNKVLVNMATYMPQSKESFISLDGCGEKLYEKCGETFLNLIKKYLNKSQSQSQAE